MKEDEEIFDSEEDGQEKADSEIIKADEDYSEIGRSINKTLIDEDEEDELENRHTETTTFNSSENIIGLDQGKARNKTARPDSRFPGITNRDKEEKKKVFNERLKKQNKKSENEAKWKMRRQKIINSFKFTEQNIFYRFFISMLGLLDFGLNLVLLSSLIFAIYKAVLYLNEGNWQMSLASGVIIVILSWVSEKIV